MNNNIAIVAVAYNRIDTLKRLLTSLEEADYGCDSPTLIISIDKSDTDIVEVFSDEYFWPYGKKIISKHESNMGLHKHMMSLGQWFDLFDNLVVLEDDIIVSSSFYLYAQKAINIYSGNMSIAGISLYGFSTNYQNGQSFIPIKNQYDGYFMNCAMSWGQIWMKSQWKAFYEWYLLNIKFEYSSEIPPCLFMWKKSWLKYHTRYCIEENKYFVFPYCSLSTNTGSVGTHSAQDDYTYQVPLQQTKTDFHLPLSVKDAICYDAFFENKCIYDVLGYSPKDLCIDLSGTNKNNQNKRYWLTNTVSDYKILKSYGMSYRPIEVNVIRDYSGNDIFLYDTYVFALNKNKTNNKRFLYACNYKSILQIIGLYGKTSVFIDYVQSIKNKIFCKNHNR